MKMLTSQTVGGNGLMFVAWPHTPVSPCIQSSSTPHSLVAITNIHSQLSRHFRLGSLPLVPLLYTWGRRL